MAVAVSGHHTFAREVQALALDPAGILLVASGDCQGGPCRGELTVLDVTDAFGPRVVGNWQPEEGYPIGMAMSADYAYLAARDAGLWLIDLSTPAAPLRVSTVPAAGFAMDVAVHDEFAYLADRGGGLYIVDVSSPRLPAVASVFPPPDEFWSVAVGDGYAYLGDRTFGLRVADVTDPTTPHDVGYVDTTGSGGVEDIALVSNTIYATAGFDGLRVIDVMNPVAPVETDAYDTPGTASAVAMADGLVYVADGMGGLFILRPK